MNNLLFILYGCIFVCLWVIFNAYSKDFTDNNTNNNNAHNNNNDNNNDNNDNNNNPLAANTYQNNNTEIGANANNNLETFAQQIDLSKYIKQLRENRIKKKRMNNIKSEYTPERDMDVILFGKPKCDFRDDLLNNNTDEVGALIVLEKQVDLDDFLALTKNESGKVHSSFF